MLDLLLSSHYGNCCTCVRNNHCELQSLAAEYGVDYYRLGRLEAPRHKIDSSSYSVVRDINKCILCRRCIRTCIDLQEVGVLEAIGRGNRTRVSTFLEKPLADVICINCGQCSNRCPTGALQANDATDDVWAAIDDPDRHVVIQTAPSPRAAIGECFGLPPGAGADLRAQHRPARLRLQQGLRHELRRRFDHHRGRDGAVETPSRRLVEGDKTVALPQFTSCSPGWVKYIEHFYPAYLPNLSTAKSPQQMFGTLLKTYYAELNGLDPEKIVTVALMPCSAKKFECNRPEMCQSGYKDVDYGLTTRELAKMIREAGIDLPKMPPSDFDDPFGTATGSGVIFGATGGVMEAALRTVLEIVTGERIEKLFDHADVMPVRGFEGVRYAEIPIAQVGPVPDLLEAALLRLRLARGATLKVAVCHGTANAKEGDGEHRRGRAVGPVPLHRVHGLPRRMPWRRRPADSDQSRHPRRPGQGDLRRGQGLQNPQIARKPGDSCGFTNGT